MKNKLLSDKKLKTFLIVIVLIVVCVVAFPIDIQIGPYLLGGRYFAKAYDAYYDNKPIRENIELVGDIATVCVEDYAVYISHAETLDGNKNLLYFGLMKVKNNKYHFMGSGELHDCKSNLEMSDFMRLDTIHGNSIYFTLVYKSVYDSDDILKDEKYSTQDIYDSVLDEDLVFVYYYGKTE